MQKDLSIQLSSTVTDGAKRCASIVDAARDFATSKQQWRSPRDPPTSSQILNLTHPQYNNDVKVQVLGQQLPLEILRQQ